MWYWANSSLLACCLLIACEPLLSKFHGARLLDAAGSMLVPVSAEMRSALKFPQLRHISLIRRHTLFCPRYRIINHYNVDTSVIVRF